MLKFLLPFKILQFLVHYSIFILGASTINRRSLIARNLYSLNPLLISIQGLQAHLHGLIDSETDDNQDHKKGHENLEPLETCYC